MWVRAMKCQQLGMWDAGRAGTHHRKKGLGRGGLRTVTDIPKRRTGEGERIVGEKVESGFPSILQASRP